MDRRPGATPAMLGQGQPFIRHWSTIFKDLPQQLYPLPACLLSTPLQSTLFGWSICIVYFVNLLFQLPYPTCLI